MIQFVGNPKYPKVYLSGPITGIENKNREEFQKYQNKLIDLGFEVINPHDLFNDAELERIDKLVREEVITEKEAWSHFLKVDLTEMFKCNFVAVLKGWEKSEGANLEVYNARKLLMPIVDAETLKEFL